MLVPSAGGLPSNLTATPEQERSPAWYPDGTKVVYVGAGNFLWVLSLAPGSTPQQLTSVPAADPAVSPDGTRVAFSSGGDIYTMPAGGGPRTLVLNQSTTLSHPTWSPTSCDLAFTYQGRVIKARADGTGISDVRASSSSPNWGPTGRIALVSSGSVLTVNPDGAAERGLASGAGSPSWSADGASNAFQATGSAPGITTRSSDGSGTGTRVTDQAGDTEPAW
jgi:Tol biopolymer transport system component